MLPQLLRSLLEGRYVDLEKHIRNDLDIELLKRTPSAYLGSCRYKLPDISQDREIYDKIFSILDELEIEYFFYIGGNDSMDTIKKLSDYALLNGSKIRFMGVPKTIDNDLAVTDHTPGYGLSLIHISVNLFCIDPSGRLRACMDQGISTILFSATLQIGRASCRERV